MAFPQVTHGISRLSPVTFQSKHWWDGHPTMTQRYGSTRPYSLRFPHASCQKPQNLQARYFLAGGPSIGSGKIRGPQKPIVLQSGRGRSVPLEVYPDGVFKK